MLSLFFIIKPSFLILPLYWLITAKLTSKFKSNKSVLENDCDDLNLSLALRGLFIYQVPPPLEITSLSIDPDE